MVYVTCMVHGCVSSSYKNQDLRFFQLPHSEDRRRLWMLACKRHDLIEKLGSNEGSLYNKYVCSLHFEKKMYSKKNLKKTASPTLKLPPIPVFSTETSETQSQRLCRQDLPSQGIKLNVETYPKQKENRKNYYPHVGFSCHNCFGEIRGYRYTCVQCLDYDLCGACEARGAHCMHYVLRISTPRPDEEIQTVLNMIRRELRADLVRRTAKRDYSAAASGLHAGEDKLPDTQPVTVEVEQMKIEIDDEVLHADPLCADNMLDTFAGCSGVASIPHIDPSQPKQILNVNNAKTPDTMPGDTLLIIENPVGTGCVASTGIILPENPSVPSLDSVASAETSTKRKHDAPIHIPTDGTEKRIKLKPRVSNVRTSSYINVPITGYVPVPTVSGTGTSYMSGGISHTGSFMLNGEDKCSFQVFLHTEKKEEPHDKPLRKCGKASTSSRSKKKKSDSTNK